MSPLLLAGSFTRAACSIIGRIRLAMYSANLRAAGEMVLDVSLLINACVLLALSPVVSLVIFEPVVEVCGMWGPFATAGDLETRCGALGKHLATPQC